MAVIRHRGIAQNTTFLRPPLHGHKFRPRSTTTTTTRKRPENEQTDRNHLRSKLPRARARDCHKTRKLCNLARSGYNPRLHPFFCFNGYAFSRRNCAVNRAVKADGAQLSPRSCALRVSPWRTDKLPLKAAASAAAPCTLFRASIGIRGKRQRKDFRPSPARLTERSLRSTP